MMNKKMNRTGTANARISCIKFLHSRNEHAGIFSDGLDKIGLDRR